MPYFLSFINSVINYCIFLFSFRFCQNTLVAAISVCTSRKKGCLWHSYENTLSNLWKPCAIFTVGLWSITTWGWVKQRGSVYYFITHSSWNRQFCLWDPLLFQIHSFSFFYSYLVAALTLTEIFDWPITVLGKGEFYSIARVYKFVFT